MTLAAQLKAKSWPVLALDAGNQVKRFGRQSEIKFQIAVEGLKKMDYRAVGFGPDDLRLSSGELLAALSDTPNRFISANTAVLDPDLTPKFQVFTVGGKKIGVTTVLGGGAGGSASGASKACFRFRKSSGPSSFSRVFRAQSSRNMLYFERRV